MEKYVLKHGKIKLRILLHFFPDPVFLAVEYDYFTIVKKNYCGEVRLFCAFFHFKPGKQMLIFWAAFKGIVTRV
jgi:hypothetical protein